MATYLSEAGPPSYQPGQTSVGTLSSAQSIHQSLEKEAVKSLATDDKEKSSYTSTIEDFPEGGLRAWLCVFGASIVMFLTYGMMQAFGVFQDYYAKHLLSNHSPSEISWIGSVQTFLLFGLGVITGRCFDNGYLFHTIIPGSLIYTFSLFMLSLCQPGRYYQFFLSQGVGLGLGMGMLAVPSASIASHYFRTNQARANGIVFAGTSLGGVVWPIILNRMINGPLGFSLSIRISGFICLGLLVAVNLLMKPRLHRSVTSQGREPFIPVIKRVLADRAFVISLLGLFLVGLGLSFPLIYLQLFASVHAVSANITQYVLGILYASGTVFGRILPGLLARRTGVLNLVILYTTLGGAFIFTMFGATNGPGIVVFAILFGPCQGACLSLFPAAISSYTDNMFEFGLRFGMLGLLYGLANLVGIPIAGALLNPPSYNWAAPIVFSGVTVLAGCVALVVSRQMLVAKKYTWKL